MTSNVMFEGRILEPKRLVASNATRRSPAAATSRLVGLAACRQDLLHNLGHVRGVLPDGIRLGAWPRGPGPGTDAPRPGPRTQGRGPCLNKTWMRGASKLGSVDPGPAALGPSPGPRARGPGPRPGAQARGPGPGPRPEAHAKPSGRIRLPEPGAWGPCKAQRTNPLVA